MEQKLKSTLAALLAAGPLALSVALAPPANAAVQTPATQEEAHDVAARLAAVQKTVAEIEGQATEAANAAPNVQQAWWANGWRNGGWHNGWRNGGWRNWGHGWHNWHNY